jgi:hypothetical protein
MNYEVGENQSKLTRLIGVHNISSTKHTNHLGPTEHTVSGGEHKIGGHDTSATYRTGRRVQTDKQADHVWELGARSHLTTRNPTDHTDFSSGHRRH